VHRARDIQGPQAAAGRDQQTAERARRHGNVRLIEVLEHDDQSLTRILEGLDLIEAEERVSVTGIGAKFGVFGGTKMSRRGLGGPEKGL
jgi:hypothetical protein